MVLKYTQQLFQVLVVHICERMSHSVLSISNTPFLQFFLFYGLVLILFYFSCTSVIPDIPCILIFLSNTFATYLHILYSVFCILYWFKLKTLNIKLYQELTVFFINVWTNSSLQGRIYKNYRFCYLFFFVQGNKFACLLIANFYRIKFLKCCNLLILS